ncbi:MAG: diguanylate cyclase [Acidobacteria bacterium]|nr:diguanylate cyclase [Acidobacteriota bacterium]
MEPSGTAAGVRVVVIGGGPEASGLAELFQSAGCSVRISSPESFALTDRDPGAPDVLVTAEPVGGSDWRAALPDRLPVVTVLASPAGGDVRRLLGRGVDDVVVRPFAAADLLARTLRAARLGQQLARLGVQRDRMSSAFDSFKRITATLDSRSVLSTIVSEVARVMAATRSSIVLVDRQRMIGNVLATFEDPSINRLEIDLRKYPEIVRVLETKRTVAIDDLASHPVTLAVRELVRAFQNVSVMVVPILWEEELLGTLFLRAARPLRPFGAEDVAYCELVAGAAVNAIRNAQQFGNAELERERQEALAITDQLTGTHNQAYLYQRLGEEYERSTRYESHFSFLMFDVDDFKRVNDTFGHLVGDGVLRELADRVRSSIRKPDIIARYGGEEFAVLLPNTALAGAVREAERLRVMVSEWQFSDLPLGERITVSLGVSTFPSAGVAGPVDLIAHADSALYAAKRAGKNCVREFPASDW